MKITLATHIVVEHVGNQVFLLDSVGKEVYCLPAEGITHYTPETKTLVVTPELVPEVTRLVDSGVATATGLISRRALVGSTGALIGGGLVAMSMPAAASSQSPGPGSQDGQNPPLEDGIDFAASGKWTVSGGGTEGSGDDAVPVAVELDINIDLADIEGLGNDLEEWTLKIFDETYVLGEDVDGCLGLSDDGVLVIIDLEASGENAGVNAIYQQFDTDVPNGTIIFATLEAGNLTGKITLTYGGDIVRVCPGDS